MARPISAGLRFNSAVVDAKLPLALLLIQSIDRIRPICMVNWNAFDLNLLRVLDAMLREPNMTRVGERIGLSQPAVSAALSRLRHTLGDPLFVREGNRMVATGSPRRLPGHCAAPWIRSNDRCRAPPVSIRRSRPGCSACSATIFWRR